MADSKADSKKAKDEIYLESQNRLIAVLISEGAENGRVFEMIDADDFEEPVLQLIFENLLEVHRRDEPVNATSVAQQLEATGGLEEAGGIKALYNFRTNGSLWRREASAEVYAAVLKEQASKHKVLTLMREHAAFFRPDSGATSSETIAAIQHELNSILFRLADESTVTEFHESLDAYDELLGERLRVYEENEGEAAGLQGIPSLIPSINKFTTGWLPGQLITVGARTGVGKSIFAMNSAVAAASAGKSVMVFSLEMGIDEIKDRIISSMTAIPLNVLKQGRLNDEQRETLMKARSDFEKMKITIDTDPGVTVDSIRARMLQKSQSEDGLDIVIIDYLQLITPTGRHESRQQAVADISRNIKLTAKQMGIPIMVLVQLNRKKSGETEEEEVLPRLDDIKESGAIGQDSDIIILLHRDPKTDDSIPPTLVILAKNRNGPADKTIRCHSSLECSLFREMQRASDAADSLTDEDMRDLDSDLSFEEDSDLQFDDDDDEFESTDDELDF